MSGFLGARRQLVDIAGDRGGAGGGAFDVLGDFTGGGALLLDRGGDDGGIFADPADDGGDGLDFRRRIRRRRLYRRDLGADLAGGPGGLGRQGLDLVGDDGEAFSRLAGPRRLDGKGLSY